jgi:cob(I)alamin adenosyltransferase
VVRIDRIYTRSGDNGMTSLGDGQRVSKLSLRIVAGGAVDETNCALGMALAAGLPQEIGDIVRRLQQFLFDLGSDLCVPIPESGADTHPGRVNMQQVEVLERLIDQFTDGMAPLTSFILPGGTAGAAALHFARSVCRRAELDVLRLNELQTINLALLIALNRLSDLLFVLGRAANAYGTDDVLWRPGLGLPEASAPDTNA